MDSRAACSLWTAMQWPSRCITERRRKTDIQRKREREAAGAHQNWPTCILSFSLSLSLWRTLTFSSPLLYNIGRFCVDPENKQYSGGEDDLFALTLLASTVVIRSSASKRKRNREERIEEKICSSHVHSSLFLQYTYRNTIKRIYVKYKKRTCVHEQREDMNDRRKNMKRWKMTTNNTFLLFFECWLISLIVLKREEIHTHVYQVGKHI
jgi:hypothetical protein